MMMIQNKAPPQQEDAMTETVVQERARERAIQAISAANEMVQEAIDFGDMDMTYALTGLETAAEHIAAGRYGPARELAQQIGDQLADELDRRHPVAAKPMAAPLHY
jgi:hypothetical protein